LLSSCWTRNGSYCQIDSDCEQGLCIGYERGVKAGICTNSLTLSSKTCTSSGIFTDSPGANRSYGQSVQIMASTTNVLTALIGSKEGFSYCETPNYTTRSDVKDFMGIKIPYGPSSRLPGSKSAVNWITSSPSTNEVFGVSISPSVEGTAYSNLKAAVTSVAASSQWVTIGESGTKTIWLWTPDEFKSNPSFPKDIEDTESGYGRLVAVTGSQLAVASDQSVFLYDINATTKALTNQNLVKPGSALNRYGSTIALSALGLVVSEHDETAAGTTIWWYPPGAKEAQTLPVPSRYVELGDSKVTSYGSALAASDNMIAIGVPAHNGVVVLDKTASGWQEISISTQAVDPASRFGAAVAVDNDWLAVGAPGENKVYLYRCN
jgi:hypothetical protein